METIKDAKSLNPIFCCKCANRIGWAEEDDLNSLLYCEECANQDYEGDEDETEGDEETETV